MDFLSDFVRVLSVASVVLAALWLVAPKGKTANMFRFAMGLFIVAMIISTFKVNFSNPPKIPDFKTNSAITEGAENLNFQTARYIIENLLTSCNIKFSEITVFVETRDDSNINITKAFVRLENDEDFDRAAEIVKNQTGIILTRQEE